MAGEGIVVISTDSAFKGSIRRCKRLEIFGFVDGEVETGELVVHDGGIFYGKVNAGAATVSGTVQGDIIVSGLIHVAATGHIAGHVHYGRLAMDSGGNLSAEMRNVPPRLAGDFEISVARGRSVRITTEDINAIDPDDKASDLVFTVSNLSGGTVAVAGGAPGTFTQADLAGGRVVFRHDGSASETASFDVVVTDKSGATSGAPQTVKVAVKAA